MTFDVKRIKAKFMIKFPRFASILNRLEIVIDNRHQTAATDGEKLYFNSDFMNSLNEEQQLFTFAHEVLHVALDHIDRSEGKNHYNWNVATDAVINDYLSRVMELDQPDGTIEIINALQYTAEQIYQKLQKKDEEEKEKKKNKDKSKTQDSDQIGNGREVDSDGGDNNSSDEKDQQEDGNGSSDSNEDEEEDKKDGNGSSSKQDEKDEDQVGHDSHSLWEEASKRHKKEREEKNKNGDSNDSSKKIDEREEFEENDRLKREKEDEFLKEGSNHTSNSSGSSRNRGRSDDSYESSDMIDWRRMLTDYLRVEYDWDGTDLYEEDGVIHSTFKQQPKAKTQIVIDSSASISEDLIHNFLNECLSILNYSEMEIGFFDNRFYGFQSVRSEDDIQELSKPGYGGTNYNAAVKAFLENGSGDCNKVIFTDGYASMPKDECNALWVVVGNHPPKINPPGGTVITISGEEYERLSKRRSSYHR